jgi:ERCC4-type nuclease
MKTGDYCCEDVGIERKKIHDFVGSFTTKKKRLWDQCDRLKKEFKYPYVVISNKTTELTSMVSDHAVIGAIAYLCTPKFYPNGTQAYPGIPVVKVDTDAQLAYLILKIMERHKKLKFPEELQNI